MHFAYLLVNWPYEMHAAELSTTPIRNGEHIHIYPAEHDKYSIHMIFKGSYNSHGYIFVYTTQLSRECMYIFPLKIICMVIYVVEGPNKY